ncbi:MAG: hypothetical protein LW635_06935, partial [Microcystis sp. 53598_E5]|nr:hypothetical protein [Microcystis sp. 53598_E5]
WLECISIVANSILLKKYAAIKIIFIRIDSLTRKTFSLEIILGRGLLGCLDGRGRSELVEPRI